ncbi:hypothetical protein PGTUg99_020678 [Puccinia graminis f. sp. tritici]|uniref:Uncharacterized protein n=1 Tax=Puccinia graminis f. sp. tritici TaxID=56615 RepID=A0A5B0RCR9_PUCGR|nr:hypothetical protein PGTUg99_020678 [Puccinia graminis f. sp. tritici]
MSILDGLQLGDDFLERRLSETVVDGLAFGPQKIVGRRRTRAARAARPRLLRIRRKLLDRCVDPLVRRIR